jgi:uncharacterized protein
MLGDTILEIISKQLNTSIDQIRKAIELLNSGSTIPFIARYRKDVTGQLDEVQLEKIAEANLYFTGMVQRKQSILDTIEKQGRLTDDLRKAIELCTDKTELEDLYLPYKRQRRTKATIAREGGLEPLAEFIWLQEETDQALDALSATFINPDKGIATKEDALEGARHILSERISLDADIRSYIRKRIQEEGRLTANSTKISDGEKTKYSAYYDFNEPVLKVPSHRLLAILRGVKEGLLRMDLEVDEEDILKNICEKVINDPQSSYSSELKSSVDDAYKRLMRPSIENEVIGIIRKYSNDHAIQVFRENAFNLLLAPPAGPMNVIGIDPGQKTGCKLAVIDSMGDFKKNTAVYLHASDEKKEEAHNALKEILNEFDIAAIAIGNGTGSREASKFVSDVLKSIEGEKPITVLVNEAGASIYSASKIAREEFPELDITIRGAISIARRLQDPLAELVKIDPKSIGVGQYQHDVNQKDLREGLHRTIESCVNRVGVDLNTASVPLLRYVSGIQYGTAQNIVGQRTERKGFTNREQLMDVDGIGPKVYEQCAGFLRIPQSDNVLDSTAIHPEAYPVIEEMAKKLEVSTKELIGSNELIKQIKLEEFITDTIGYLTLTDIRDELLKPGRDPREHFEAPEFLEGVEDVKDLEVGMEIKGVISNVTDFGAFVDIGVHQDGLVHLSQLAHKFVRDPREIVRVGQIVHVKVIEVDKKMPRISLSMKSLQPKPEVKTATRPRKIQNKAERPQKSRKNIKKKPKQTTTQNKPSKTPLNTQLADQLAGLRSELSNKS